MQLGWIAFSKQDRTNAINIINSMKEKDVLDELGFGSLRQAFANLTFHFVFFEFGTLDDDTGWNYRVKKESSSDYFLYGGIHIKNSIYKFRRGEFSSNVKSWYNESRPVEK